MLLEKDLSYIIQGCIYNVSNKYGKGLKENIYQNVLKEEFLAKGLKFESQKRIDIYSFDTGKKLGTYIPDFVIEDKIILEIKASYITIAQDIEQQLSYLRISEYEIGYLVNFCSEELYIKRFIFTNNRKSFLKTRIDTNENTDEHESKNTDEHKSKNTKKHE